MAYEILNRNSEKNTILHYLLLPLNFAAMGYLFYLLSYPALLCILGGLIITFFIQFCLPDKFKPSPTLSNALLLVSLCMSAVILYCFISHVSIYDMFLPSATFVLFAFSSLFMGR